MLNQRWESSWSGLLHLSRFPLFFYMLVILNLPTGLWSPTSMHLPFIFWNRSIDSVCFSSEKNSVSPASYTDVSPSTKLYAQRKAERRKWWRRGFAYHFSLSHSPVHFIISQSRVPRVFARLCVKNSAHEEEANVSPKKLECPPENCWLGQIVLLKGNFGSDTASKSGYLMSCNRHLALILIPSVPLTYTQLHLPMWFYARCQNKPGFHIPQEEMSSLPESGWPYMRRACQKYVYPVMINNVHVTKRSQNQPKSLQTDTEHKI